MRNVLFHWERLNGLSVQSKLLFAPVPGDQEWCLRKPVLVVVVVVKVAAGRYKLSPFRKVRNS
jgi:hypothetical protein